MAGLCRFTGGSGLTSDREMVAQAEPGLSAVPADWGRACCATVVAAEGCLQGCVRALARIAAVE